MAKQPVTPTPQTGMVRVGDDQQKRSLALSAGTVPEWMKNEKAEGVDMLAKFQTSPRISIIQGSSKPDRKMEFGEGSVVCMPDGIPIAKLGEEFVVIPLVFWPTWEKWSDINDQSNPMVMEVSQDENSEIARKAKNRTQRVESYKVGSNDFKMKFVEYLNFVVLLDSGPAKGEIGLISFHIGEHRTGLTLSGNIKRRNCSIFGNRFSLKTAVRNRNNRSWYGFDINNPGDETGGYVQDQAFYKHLQTMHQDLRKMVESSQIGIVRDEDEGTDEGTASDLPV